MENFHRLADILHLHSRLSLKLLLVKILTGSKALSLLTIGALERLL